MLLKDLKKSEKGSITILVLSTMLLVVGVVFVSYFSMMNKSSSQAAQLERIQDEYNQSNTDMAQIYDEVEGDYSQEVSEEKPSTSQNEPITNIDNGAWIWYETPLGNRIKCVILYDDSNDYGIQAIAMETVEDIKLGGDNFNSALSSYNYAIGNLNTIAMNYKNKNYATDARSVGSVPFKKDNEMAYREYNSVNLRDGDENETADCEQMQKLGISNIGKAYWLASRVNSNNADFGVRFMINKGMESSAYLINVNSKTSSTYSYGLRPVFTLKEDLITKGGSGTQEDPYSLSVN